MGINHLTTNAMNKATNQPSSESHECLEWPESHEGHVCLEGLEGLKCPEPHVSPKLPESLGPPVSPVSEGQELDRELESLAAECACISAEDKPSGKVFE